VRSFWWRRHRAISLFIAGYLLVWLLMGIPAALVPPSPLLAAISLALAAAWFLAPVKRRLRLGCHLTIPMEPAGWRADRDCIRFGWKIGLRCAGNCGVLMVACATLGHVLIGTVLIAALTLLERARPVNVRAVAAALLMSSVAVIVPTFVQAP
jgi:predicted metal-binding membrane protein